MEQLQKALFEFAKSANHLNQELRQVPSSSPNIASVFDLQDYLSVIARKAEHVAALVGQPINT